MLTETEWYEIDDRGGLIGDGKGTYKWKTRGEAIDVATKFKNDPRSHNPKITDDNVEYWKRQVYTVRRVTKIVLELDII